MSDLVMQHIQYSKADKEKEKVVAVESRQGMLIKLTHIVVWISKLA